MSEMPHASAASTFRSACVSRPLTAWMRMWGSRFCIPLDPSREWVIARIDHHFWNAPDQIRTSLADRRQFGHRMAVVCNQDAIGRQVVHQRQPPLPELTDVHLLHHYSVPTQAILLN